MGLIGPDFKVPQIVFEVWTFIKGAAFKSPPTLPEYLESTLPPAADWTRGLVYVKDGPAGDKVRYSDGSAWITLG